MDIFTVPANQHGSTLCVHQMQSRVPARSDEPRETERERERDRQTERQTERL